MSHQVNHRISTPPSSPRVVYIENVDFGAMSAYMSDLDDSSSWGDITRPQTPDDFETESDFGSCVAKDGDDEANKEEKRDVAVDGDFEVDDAVSNPSEKKEAVSKTPDPTTWVPSDMEERSPNAKDSQTTITPAQDPKPALLTSEDGQMIVALTGKISSALQTLMQHSSMTNAKIDDQAQRTAVLAETLERRKKNICSLNDGQKIFRHCIETEAAALRQKTRDLEEERKRLETRLQKQMALLSGQDSRLQRQIEEIREGGKKSELMLLEKMEAMTVAFRVELEQEKETRMEMEKKFSHKLTVEAHARMQVKRDLEKAVQEEMIGEAESRRQVKRSLEARVEDQRKRMDSRLGALQDEFQNLDEKMGALETAGNRWAGTNLRLTVVEHQVKQLGSGAESTKTTGPVQTRGANTTSTAASKQAKQSSRSAETKKTAIDWTARTTFDLPPPAAKQVKQPVPVLSPAFKKRLDDLGLSVNPPRALAVVTPTAFAAQFEELEKQTKALQKQEKQALPRRSGSKSVVERSTGSPKAKSTNSTSGKTGSTKAAFAPKSDVDTVSAEDTVSNIIPLKPRPDQTDIDAPINTLDVIFGGGIILMAFIGAVQVCIWLGVAQAIDWVLY
ncbi:hypothetical protein K490DRAFT_55409 [Saccharata proteae CBS 121410]|uniref:Uncharacterized protein n=1 Tax=Saccharata proteae CBS 121410 TaxID=1314787 RepID=A0A6A5YD63_9PEZI|nr:hypothetical protein K490DRAFT_55409 [Saccharata proteae CBS 121410]